MHARAFATARFVFFLRRFGSLATASVDASVIAAFGDSASAIE
jgi:hypothetical protein